MTPTPATHDEVARLIDELALGLIDDSDRPRFESHIDQCDRCTAAMRSASALVGVSTIETPSPPPFLRSRVLEAAFETRGTAPATSRAALAAWEAETGRFLAQAKELAAAHGSDVPAADSAWNQSCIPAFDLSARDVVSHVVATLGVWSSKLGADIGADNERHPNIEQRTRAVIHRHAAAPIRRMIDELDAAYREIGDRLRALTREQWSEQSAMAPNFTVESYCALLALETWTHADDIRLCTGRQPRRPETTHLATMTQVLPLWVSMVLERAPGSTPSHYRLDLTGDAPAEFDITPHPDAALPATRAPDFTITCDAIEFCKLAGARRTPATFNHLATGDLDLASSFVSALAEFALI